MSYQTVIFQAIYFLDRVKNSEATSWMKTLAFFPRWMDYLSGLMATKVIDDDRTVEHYFSVPGLGVFAIGLPIALFWVQLAMVSTLWNSFQFPAG